MQMVVWAHRVHRALLVVRERRDLKVTQVRRVLLERRALKVLLVQVVRGHRVHRAPKATQVVRVRKARLVPGLKVHRDLLVRKVLLEVKAMSARRVHKVQ